MEPPEPGTREPTWQAQWRRANRWLIRLRAAHERELSYIHQPWCSDAVGLDLYQDDVVAFFQACYHLKDWLKKDPSSSEIAGDVEKFVNATDCMLIAADVVNRSKHGRADTNPRRDMNAQPRTHRGVVYASDGQFEEVGEEVVLVNEQFRPAFELAEVCVEAWEAYLKERGLL